MFLKALDMDVLYIVGHLLKYIYEKDYKTYIFLVPLISQIMHEKYASRADCP